MFKKGKSFLKGIILGLVLGIILSLVIGFTFQDALHDKMYKIKEDIGELLDKNFLGYTAADFEDAILSKSKEKQELIVMEQPLSITTTITKSGLGNFEIFQKTKDIMFNAVGTYTVDLEKITKNNVTVNQDNKIVSVKIPHVNLYGVNIDYDNIQFFDTEKGLLAFGDISLKTEQQNELYKSVEAQMREELLDEKLLAQADDLAKYKTWELFQPLVSAISEEYLLLVTFED